MESKRLTLNDGRTMPQLGFGVWQVPEEETANAVAEALAIGFRLIDTAAGYQNEAGVGQALRTVSVPREDVFVTTKLTNSAHGFDAALAAFEGSMTKLGLDEVDLYLIHWPRPSADLFVETWRALVRLREEGRASSIGVSNFTKAHLQRLFDETGVVPAVNQVELHPHFQQHELRAFHAAHGIVTQSWSPLGRGRLEDNPVIAELAQQYGKTWAQIVLRWHLDSGLSVLSKSVTPARIRENYEILDFTLAPEAMARIATLDRADGRVGSNPDSM